MKIDQKDLNMLNKNNVQDIASLIVVKSSYEREEYDLKAIATSLQAYLVGYYEKLYSREEVGIALGLIAGNHKYVKKGKL